MALGPEDRLVSVDINDPHLPGGVKVATGNLDDASVTVEKLAVEVPTVAALESLTFRVTAVETLVNQINARVTVLENAPPPPPPPPADPQFAFAWWGKSTNSADVVTRANIGYTHNFVWSNDTSVINVAYLDILHTNGIKCITVLDNTTDAAGVPDHVAVVGAIVADEPDLWAAGAPKRTPELVDTSADLARTLKPGVTVYMTGGSPLAAGPRDTTIAESTAAGYWSLEAGSVNSTAAVDLSRFASYANSVDFILPQMYTVAGRDAPKFRKYPTGSGAPDLNPQQAGVRESAFVAKGMARAKRLVVDNPAVTREITLGALLAPMKFWTETGSSVYIPRDPTLTELIVEADAVYDAGGEMILYFDSYTSGGQPDLVDRPTQLGYVEQVIQHINDRKAQDEA